MVIIGLLASYVGPRYFSQIGRSEIKAARAQIDGFEKALEQYRLDTGHFPSTEQGLAALFVKPTTSRSGPGRTCARRRRPTPWGNAYQYKSPGEHGEFDLLSFGKDGRAGGTGETPTSRAGSGRLIRGRDRAVVVALLTRSRRGRMPAARRERRKTASGRSRSRQFASVGAEEILRNAGRFEQVVARGLQIPAQPARLTSSSRPFHLRTLPATITVSTLERSISDTTAPGT